MSDRPFLPPSFPPSLLSSSPGKAGREGLVVWKYQSSNKGVWFMRWKRVVFLLIGRLRSGSKGMHVYCRRRRRRKMEGRGTKRRQKIRSKVRGEKDARE